MDDLNAYEPMEEEEVLDQEPEGESVEDKAKRLDQVLKFAEIIKDKRKKAIDARRASGIEQIWQEDEDHYEGVDDYSKRTGYVKGRTTSDGPRQEAKKAPNRSTAFANITRPYCDAGAARVADMLLPTDDRNWAIKPTPIPQVSSQLQGAMPGIPPQPAMQPGMPEQQQAPGMLSRIGGAVRSMFGGEQPQAEQPQPQAPQVDPMQAAKSGAAKAQEQIDDWLVECGYHAEVRKVIESAARLGVGILKGPHPTRKVSRAAVKGPDGRWQVTMRGKVSPASICVSPWNFYPDGNCGEKITNGSFVFERDDITARALRELKEDESYIPEMVDMCLKEGPMSSHDNFKQRVEEKSVCDDDLFEIWYFQGVVSREDMEAAGCDCDGEKEEYPCIVTMVNDRVIKVAQNTLDSGEFNYDVMVWQQKIGHWAGIGIARQMRTCQKGLNSAVRAMMDNAGLSSGPQIIIDSSKIEPADGKWNIAPLKIWRKKIDSEEVGDVRQAFTIVSIETRQGELLNIIQFWSKEAEDITGLPMLLQGQQGKAPETVGGMAMLNNNAHSVLRRIARTFDDLITEPHIGRYYEWLLMYGPDEAKGDYQIDARGSSALVERDIQNQAMFQLLGMSLNPAYGVDPELVMQEVLKGMRLDPKSFVVSEEKKQAAANQPPPEDPRITAAKIMAESKNAALQAKGQADLAKLQHEANENALDRQADANEKAADRSMEQWIAQLSASVEQANMTMEERQEFEKLKVNLSGLAMKIKAQKEMTASQMLQPPIEPAGRAPNGQAFIK